MGELIPHRKHFVLVHGSCHGAWCWYKLKPLLESSGHHVTALDMAASGIDMKEIKEINTLREYTEPLLKFLESLDNDEKVILVGHSFGGFNLALAMEYYPNKISVAVYLTAFMPDITHSPSFVFDKLFESKPSEAWLDTEFAPFLLFGPKFISSKLYQLTPTEDLELAKSLARPGYFFLSELSASKNFSREGYGSVKRIFIVCSEDQGIPKEFQLWMIENYPVEQVFEIKDSDHMPMLCKPKELRDCLSEIADNYA
ncbi:methylesterase 1-like [Rutidosis leptorrhynchoides]|uniref:methylesterase 1-like n=1 Tax=Rutidosis leptorrhynchoides TaxID=125765 RepID=UPI003A99FCD8